MKIDGQNFAASIQVSEQQLISELKALRERHLMSGREITDELLRLQKQAGKGHFKSAYLKAGWTFRQVSYYLYEKWKNIESIPKTGSEAIDFKGSIILADPPWQYDFAETDSRKIENQYPTMTVEEICALNPCLAENAILFLWATAPKLREALQVVEAWRFEYRTHAIWDKEKIGMGYWFRGQHELLLVAVRGAAPPPVQEIRVGSVIRSPRATHSEKPEAVYKIIEQAYPTQAKIELFARGSVRSGWTAWGNEVVK